MNEEQAQREMLQPPSKWGSGCPRVAVVPILLTIFLVWALRRPRKER